ncbi:MAG: 2-C-methyl-D-erythritol 4-phosphate cytidylyltransferase [Bacteroidales bacterium]|nr:2-C-methyl-D-erythritol 4-phosphate cytidylyltransferase [Bacteroidales bacterium]
MNIAIILAGGIGARLSTDIPKQFLKIDGKTIIEHTLSVFEQHSQIDEIAIVVNAQYLSEMRETVQYRGFKKIKKIIEGGTQRQDSCWAAIQSYSNYPEANLIIHDAVRPLVSAEIISEVILKLEIYNAVTVAIPSTDTIYKVENSCIQQVPNRKNLMRAQTPQAFKQHIIEKAYLSAYFQNDFLCTDDCGIVAKYLPDEPIFVVAGNERNFKITHNTDLYILEHLLNDACKKQVSSSIF